MKFAICDEAGNVTGVMTSARQPRGNYFRLRDESEARLLAAGGKWWRRPDGILTLLKAPPSVPVPTPREQACAMARVQLADSDSGMIRVLEDLVALLIAKGVIAEGDLPRKVQEKLTERKALRAVLQG